jgi:hypothetical protein
MTALLKTTQIQEPSSATVNITLDTSGGTSVNYIQGSLINGTALPSTSGSTIDFSGSTGVPSWVKRVTVLFAGVSLSSSGNLQVLLGTGVGPTYTTSGYLGEVTTQSGATAANLSTAFTLTASSSAAVLWSGALTLYNITGNTWVASSQLASSGTTTSQYMQGYIALGSALTAIRVNSSGADTFDAGTINIQYEG